MFSACDKEYGWMSVVTLPASDWFIPGTYLKVIPEEIKKGRSETGLFQ